jgi:hypothetical protein
MRAGRGLRSQGHWINVCLFLAVTGGMAATTHYLTAQAPGVVYPLDDTYIHLAMARTFADTAVWGLHPSQPAAASSSPLWTGLLALLHWLPPAKSDELFSAVPLALNLIAGIGVIVLLRAILAGSSAEPLYTLIAWLAVPLPVIALIGMEHVLHTLLALALAYVSVRAIASEQPNPPAELGIVAALSLLAMGARYESAALIASLCALSLLRGKGMLCVALAAPAAAVVLACGIIWIRHGGSLLPNSLLLKGMSGSLATDSVNAIVVVAGSQTRLLANSRHAPLLLASVALICAHVMSDLKARKLAIAVLAVGAVAFVMVVLPHFTFLALIPIDLLMGVLAWAFVVMGMQAPRGVRPDRLALFGLAIAPATVLQLMFGSVGWLNRYEAWLVALNIAALLLLLERYCGSNRIFRLAALAVLVAGLSPTVVTAMAKVMKAPIDRVWEHFAPVRILNANYAGDAVIINDIGASAYYGKTIPVDMYGLGNNERLRLVQQGRPYEAPQVAELARSAGAKIAVLQMCWGEVNSRVPPGWRLVALWRGPRNVVFGDLLVGFLALSENDADALARATSAFATPPGVKAFDRNSAPVAAFNDADDKRAAARELCRSLR